MVGRILVAAVLLLAGCGDDVGGSAPAAFLEAPSNLAGAAQNGGMEIALSWIDRTSGETGYRLEVNDGPFGNPPYLDAVFLAADATSHVYPCEPNLTRHFRVFAITSASESEPSDVVAVTTPDVPFPPAHFTALATGPASIDLRWVNGEDTTGNTLERSADGGSSWTVVFSSPTGPGTAGAADSPLTQAADYLYRVRATGINGESGSSFASARTQAAATIYSHAGTDWGSRTSYARAAGVDHIVHYDNTDGVLRYTSGIPTGYTTIQIDNGQDDAWSNLAPGYHGTSVALDRAGKVHAAASNYWFDNRIRYITNSDGMFAASTVDAVGGIHPKLQVSPSDGSIQIVYQQRPAPYSTPIWAFRMPGQSTWTFENVPVNVVGIHSFAIDGQGIPHVITVVPGRLWHWWRTPDHRWNATLIPTQGEMDDTSAAIGPTGVLHVAIHNVTTGRLMCATNPGGVWAVETVHVHTTGNLGSFNSIAVDASGKVGIAYYNSVQGDLWYAEKPAGGAWNRRLLDSAGDVGRYPSLVFDGGAARIAYYDATNGDLKLVVIP